MSATTPIDVDSYLATLPADRHEAFIAVRERIHASPFGTVAATVIGAVAVRVVRSPRMFQTISITAINSANACSSFAAVVTNVITARWSPVSKRWG